MRFRPPIQNSSCYFSRLKRVCSTQILTSTEHTLPFLGPAKCWKSISAAHQNPEILAISSSLWLAHAFPPTDTKFKPLLLPTQTGMPFTNTHKHRTSYFKSTLTFLGAAKRWKLFSATRRKPEILAALHQQHNSNI